MFRRDRCRLRRGRFGLPGAARSHLPLAVTIGLLLLLAAIPARAAAVALVLAIDVSESVSSERYLLQHEGIARAFESSQLMDAIAAVPGGIEALVLEWSDPDKIAITVGWTRITNRNGAAAFAASVRATRRSSGGPAAFVLVAKNFDSFADAMLRKLVQEVASAPLATDAEVR